MRAALAIALLCAGAHQAVAQGPPAADSAARDSVLRCAVIFAQGAGFRLAPTQRPGRTGLMRTIESPGPRQVLDGMRLTVPPGDSAGVVRVDVQVTTFMMARTGLDNEEVPPRASLVALADTLRTRCRSRPAAPPAR